MDFTSDLIWLTVIIATVALAFGWFASYTKALRPTLGDVLRATATTSGLPALMLIAFIWWVV